MTSQVQSISPRRLEELRNQGQEVELIDVRTPAEYRAGHVLGSKLVPLDELGPETLEGQLNNPGAGHGDPLYLTCQSGYRAQQAADRLAAAGYRNLALIEGGTQAWEKAGLPMQRCGNAISMERQVQITIGLLLILKVVFGFTVHELFFAATAFIGTGLIVAGTTRWCGMARLIALLPWNRNGNCSEQATT